MRFEKFVEESDRLLNSFPQEVERSNDDPLVWAYWGDAWFSLYVRSKLVNQGSYKVRVLQNLEGQIVSAECQAVAWRELGDEWTTEEQDIFRRGRNASPSRGRGGPDYRTSTGYEAILGFLLEKEQNERLEIIAEKSLQAIFSFLKAKGGK